MASGTFIAGEVKDRPGVYELLVAAAQARVSRGTRGRVALPVRAEWGPETTQEITDESQIASLYWQAKAGNTVRLLSLGWKAAPSKFVSTRLVGSSGAKATATLQDTAGSPVNVVTLTALHKGARPNAAVGAWSAVTAVNIDDGAKKDLKLYEGSTLLATWTFDGTPTDVVAKVTADSKGFLTAAKIVDGTATVANTTGRPFAGGDSGLSVTNQIYLDWLTAMEAYREFDVITYDGVGDSSLQDSLVAWLNKVRGQGLRAQAAMGEANDTNPATASTRAKGINNRAVGYAISGGYLTGEATVYTPAEAAVWVGVKMAATQLKDSFTGATTPFSAVGRKLTHTQIATALQSGAMPFVETKGAVYVERALNTFNAPGAAEDISWQSIKVSSILDAVSTDLAAMGNANYVGLIPNTTTARSAVVGAILEYFRVLAQDSVVQPAYSAAEDSVNPSSGRAANFTVGYTPVDAVETIYLRTTAGV